jgi:hypothetical protein
VKPWAAATVSNAAWRAARSRLVRRGNCRATSHAGSAFTTRLRPMNSPSTALYTRTPVKNRVPISRHCAASGRSGQDRTWVGAPFGRFRARGLPTRLLGRCRCPPVGLTHSTTVEVTTDNNDLSPGPA